MPRLWPLRWPLHLRFGNIFAIKLADFLSFIDERVKRVRLDVER